MRRTSLALLAAACLLAGLTACGTDSPSNDKPAAQSSSPSPSPWVVQREQYLEAAHSIPFNGTPSDVELLGYPEPWCDALKEGHSVEWMFDIFKGGMYPIGEEWGTAEPDAHELLVAGVRVYCPEHLSAVQEELRASGKY